jgi:hypothetical protein
MHFKNILQKSHLRNIIFARIPHPIFGICELRDKRIMNPLSKGCAAVPRFIFYFYLGWRVYRSFEAKGVSEKRKSDRTIIDKVVLIVTRMV